MTATRAFQTNGPGNTAWENDEGMIGPLYDNPNAGINAQGRPRFDRAYTTIPETQYAIPGLIMSTTADLGPAEERESGASIATALRQAGYQTYWVYEAQDLFQGGGVLNNLEFDGFDGRFGIDDNRAFASSEQVIELLESQDGQPFGPR